MGTVAKHGGDILDISTRLGLSPEDLIDFSSNVNPYGPPSNSTKTIASVLNRIKFYPSRSYLRLREGIAEYAGVKAQEVIIGCGTTELIHSIITRFVKGAMILPVPTFSEYEAAATALGLKVRFVEPVGLKLNLEKTIELVRGENLGCVPLCNPNNPTGEALDTKKIVELVEVAENKRTLVIIDEAYIELSENIESLTPLTRDFSNLIVLRSITKPFGFPGLRVGYGICNSNLAEKFEKTAISWRVGVLEEAAVLSALEEKKFLKQSIKMIKSEKEKLFREIKSLNGFVPIPSNSNFFMINTRNSKLSSNNLRWRLLAYGILVKDLSSTRGISDSYIRISVRREWENKMLVESLHNLTSSMVKIYPNNPVCAEKKCHSFVHDCRLCFCPFYPCLDKTTRGRFVKRERGGIVWSCINCSWAHRAEVADRVLQELSELEIGKTDPETLLAIRKRILEGLPP